MQEQKQDQRIDGLTEADRAQVCHGRGNKNGVTEAAVAPSEGRKGLKRDTAPGTEPISLPINYVHNTFNSYSYTDRDSDLKAFGISRI